MFLTVTGPLMAQNSPSGPLEIPAGPFMVDPALDIRIALEDGRRVEGGVQSWTREGFQGAFGQVDWRSLTPVERFRIRRQCMKRSSQDTLEGWAALAVDMLAIGDSDRLSRQALSRVKAMVGREAAGAAEAQIQAQAEELRRQWELQDSSREAQRLKTSPPHIQGYGTTTWPLRDPVVQDAESERVRTRMTELTSGLQLNPAQSASVIAMGSKEIEEVAVAALRMDDLHAKLAEFLDASSKVNIFPGVAGLLMMPTHDQLRVLAAEHFGHVIPSSITAALFFDGEIPIIVVLEQDDQLENRLNHARMFTLAFLQSHLSDRELPPWIETGLSEYFAHTFVADSTIDQDRRYRALSLLRSGKHPGWILDVKADDPRLRPDGPGRDLAYLLVTRMIEDNPRGMRRLITDLKGGATLQDAFPRSFRIGPGSYMNDSARWFQFND